MRITIIGSGNVATHLGAALKNAGHKIIQVYSPTLQNASLLAYHLGADPVDDLSDIDPQTDIFIVAVKDDAVINVAEKLAPYNVLLVHTSGAVGIEPLMASTTKCGVFYPLQTFSKQKEVNFRAVPICIEGATNEILVTLAELAKTISDQVSFVNSKQRKILHLAAVFACNFPNYLYNIAEQLLADNQLEFDLLRPLITETADKVQQGSPAAVQTGPAIRGDRQTMHLHEEMLKDNPLLKNIYGLLSEGIGKMAKNRKTA